MSQTIRVLFVCSANLCRSVSMVEFARRAATSHQHDDGESPMIDWRFESAGTEVAGGQRLPDPIARTMHRLGIPPRDQPVALSESYVRSADVILTAERRHRAVVARRFPFAVRYTFTLLQFSRLMTAGRAAWPERSICDAGDLLRFANDARSNSPPIADDTIDIDDPVPMRSEPAMITCAEIIAAAVDNVIGVGCRDGHHRGH